jgi:hypothetical protein
MRFDDVEPGHPDDISDQVMRLVSVLRGPTEQIQHFVFSPDETLLGAARLDGTVRL